MAVVEFVAPTRVYQVPLSSASERMEKVGYDLPIPLGLAKTKTGGLATWFPGHPFPRKTFVYTGITQTNNKAKRITLSLFLPFASLRHGLKAFFNSYFQNYVRLIDSIYADCDQIPYLHYQYYSEFGKALWDFIYLFLKKLGIEDGIAHRVGLQLTTMIEYDDAYKIRLQDILNESNKEDLIKTPRKEILRLLKIFDERDGASKHENKDNAGMRMIKMGKLLTYLLWLPPIKKAYRFALENVNFEWFQYDEIDRYWCLNRSDYNCLGLPFEERKEMQIGMMIEFAKKINPGKEISRVENPDGTIQIIVNQNAI